MALSLHADPVQHREPGVAKGSVLGRDDTLAEFQPGPAAGEDGGAIAELVSGADVAAIGEGNVIEETRAVRFLRRLEFVDKPARSSLWVRSRRCEASSFSPNVV